MTTQKAAWKGFELLDRSSVLVAEDGTADDLDPDLTAALLDAFAPGRVRPFPRVITATRPDVEGITPGNLVANHGFEIDTTGWGQVASSTLTRTTDEKRFGVAAAQIVTGAMTSSGLGQTVTQPVVNGETYTASLWCLVPAGKAMRFRLLDGASTLLQTTSFSGAGAWEMVSVTATGNADARMFIQLLRNDGLTTEFTFYVDAVRLEVGATASDYTSVSSGGVAVSYEPGTEERLSPGVAPSAVRQFLTEVLADAGIGSMEELDGEQLSEIVQGILD